MPKNQFVPRYFLRLSLFLLLGLAMGLGNARGESLEEQLFVGLRAGDLKATQEALGLGARLDGVDLTTGETPLAAALPFPALVDLLLQRGSNPEQLGADGRRPLEIAMAIALESGNLKVVRRLLEAGAATTKLTLDGRPALLTLAMRKQFSLIQALVEKGADPLVRDAAGNTIGMLAVESIAERHRYRELEVGEFLAWLKDHGLTYQAENGIRETVPVIALKHRFRLLVEQTDFDDRFEKQANAIPTTPPEMWFAMAFQERDESALLKLLPRIDVARMNRLSDRSLLLAAYELNSLPVFQALLSAGLDWRNAEDGAGEGVFFKATRAGKRDFARALLSAGANPAVLDRSGVCGAFGAALAGDLSMVQQFVTGGTPATLANEGGFSLLMCAVYSGNLELAKYLVSQGADPNAKDAEGNTALTIAVARQDVLLVRLLDKDESQKEWLKPFTHLEDRAFPGTWHNGRNGFDAMKLDLRKDGTGDLTVGFGQITPILWKRKPAFTIALLIRPTPDADELLEVPGIFDVAAIRLILDFGNRKEAMARGEAPTDAMKRPQIEAAIEAWRAGRDDSAVLALAAADLQDFPLSVLLLDRLQRLDLSGNQLKFIPESIGQLNKLQGLQFSGNQLTALPLAVANLRQLREIYAGRNLITRLPGDISRLEELEVLHLENNRIGDLPSGFGNLKRLRDVNLASNRLRHLPDNLGTILPLENLDLRRNALTKLPSNLSGLIRLTTLRLGSNHFEEFPVSVSGLQQLQTLDLANNRLKTLPPDILKLGKLETLDLRFNRFESVPRDLLAMKQLRHLLIAGNPLPEKEVKALRNALNKTRIYFSDEDSEAEKVEP